MSKEVYKTIKRSISATANGIVNSTPFGSGAAHSRLAAPAGASNGGVKTKCWIHPPDVLINGHAEYGVKMLGHTQVSEPKGSHVVKDAIHALRFHLQIQQGVAGHSGSKLRKVDIQISISGLKVLDSKSKMVLFNHPLHSISFCADDKLDKRVFSYIAKFDSRHECFVFLSSEMAEQITLTIGEAFDLAYERFIKKNGRQLENQKLIIMLRKRVNELEAEVSKMKEQLELDKGPPRYTGAPETQTAPLVPSTPIPPVPPTFANNAANSPLPLLPPPQPNNRRPSNPANGGDASSDLLFTLSEIFDRERQGPEVGTRLENLRLDQLEDLFDQDFNPREGEPSASSATKEEGLNEPEGDLDAMLRRVNERILQQMSLGAGITTGDTGDTGRDWDEPSAGGN